MRPTPPVDRTATAGTAPETEGQSRNTTRKPRALACLLGILLLRSILGLAYATALPLGTGLDEAAHFSYIQFFVTHGYVQLPREFWRLADLGQEPAIGTGYESHQPPLYYALVSLPLRALRAEGSGPDLAGLTPPEHGALVYGVVPQGTVRENVVTDPTLSRDWYLARLFSVVLGLLPACAAYLIGRQLWPTYTPAVMMAAVTAFTPQTVYMSATVNNDLLAIGVGGLAIHALITATRNHGLRHWLLFGFWAGLGALSKFTVITVVLSVLPAIVLWPQPKSRKLLALVAACVALVLMSGWYFAYRYATTGDPTGVQSSRELYARYGSDIDRSLSATRAANDLVWTFESAWSLPTTPAAVYLSKWWYVGFALLTLVALWGAGLVILSPRLARLPQHASFLLLLLVAALQIAVYVVTYVVSDVRVNLNQGRFLYLAWYALAASLTFALGRLPGVRNLPPYLVGATLTAILVIATWATLQYYLIPFLQS